MPNLKNKNGKNMRQPVYAGISIEDGGFCVAVKSGRKIFTECIKTDENNIDRKIFSWLYRYPLSNNVKIIGAGIVVREKNKEREMRLATDLWLKEDIAPFFLKNNNGDGYEKAKRAADEIAGRFRDNNLVDIKFDTKRKVVVEELARLEEFKETVSMEEFDLLIGLARKFKHQRGKLVFFSSTPRGGGVALMRHALIRFYRLLGVNAQWYVMTSKEDIFEITKKKFHNVLQNVAPKGTKLTKADKDLFNKWSKKNAEKFNSIFKKANVVVIDDPQPSGLIPYIKKANKKAKIIYRSHIQIVADLIKKEGPQKITWDFIWNNVKRTDIFVSHPIKEFIPYNVPKEKTVLMGAVTDDLDGLNKKLAKRHMQYYFDMFNDILDENKQTPLNVKRPYIIQVARFDPSKGIPDVLESYRGLRKKIEKKGWPRNKIPQLVITGHGAVDDPEGTPIYEETINTLEMDRYKKFAGDVKVARLPHNDQILNALLRGSFIALQLSRKEGFEIKVSEALDKGKPVIAYRTGGIPLQIKNKVNGYLVKVGDTGKVADLLYKMLTDKDKYVKLSNNAKEKVERDFFTVNNAIKWLYLATELIEKGEVKGNRQHVRDLIEKEKKVQLRKYLPMWFSDIIGVLKK